MELKYFNDWLLAPKFKGRGFEPKFLLLAKRLQILIVSKMISGEFFDKLTRGLSELSFFGIRCDL